MAYEESTPSLSAALSRIATEPDYRILRRVVPPRDFPVTSPAQGAITRIVLIDVETTGLDAAVNDIIDLALLVVGIDEKGSIVEIGQLASGLRDPGFALPPAIIRLTGLTDEAVRGRAIDTDAVLELIGEADWFYAHNARFDRPFVEAQFPELAGRNWACSLTDIDWTGIGLEGGRLGHLLTQLGYFNHAHRAAADVVSLLHVIAYRLDDGTTIAGRMLDRARLSSWRITALGAPIQSRHVLKARGYHWDPQRRSWWIEVAEEVRVAELIWLESDVLPRGRIPSVEPVTARDRHA